MTSKTEWANKPEDAQVYDDAFWVKKLRWGTFTSVDKEGTNLVTSLTETMCVDATRFYLKGTQEGWDESKTSTFSGTVGGKL